MDYIIRTVTPADLDAVCRVENRCFPAAEAATREAFRTRISLFPERFLVAEHPTAGVIGLINGCCTDTPVLSRIAPTVSKIHGKRCSAWR